MTLRNTLAFAGRGAAAAALLLGSLTAVPAEAAAAPAVEVVDGPGLAKVVAAQKGRVVVLNFWATWCEPCREEFPDLVRLAKENPATMTLVTVSLDDRDEAERSVRPFLARMDAPGVALIKGPGDPDAFIDGVDPGWSGALPATFVHAADGARAHAVHGPVDYARLSGLVAPLLQAARAK